MMQRIAIWSVVLSLMFLPLKTALGAESVKIGLLAPLTGPAAADGASVNNAVQLAVEKVNKGGGLLGKHVELVVYDDRADGKEAVGLAQKLIQQDRVVGVVGGSYSTPSRAVAPIFQEEGIPFIAAYAVHPDITTAGDYCFRNGFLGMVEGRGAAYVAVNKLKAKKIALLVSDNDFGRTLAAGFKEYLAKNAPSVELVYEQAYPFKEQDFKPYLASIKEKSPDLIFASGYYFQTGPIVSQARELGITATIFGEEGADSPKFLEIAGKAAEGFLIVTNLNRDDPRPEVQEFLKVYRERYRIEPDMVGASAYDAFMILCDAIRRAGSTDGPAVKKALGATNNFNGLTGTIQGFTTNGEVVKDVQVQIVKDGAFRYFDVVKDPAVITP
ncbi:ABC transporter substrate-binding protein [Desulfosoma caldarium]|uniref:Branched-chain amino acid transport system substrate-binding protein n=1 Tax=Desulfosoma caldarium TaxID=610254 RepID=A0A3N1UG27_9BACT|nr:ABC transporter substrate-binding protein [Desulfosoma caldarium]ROQ90224.1 branched-chain amino acid transport system substrate-binding protein [Desulfosoma caldarium]